MNELPSLSHVSLGTNNYARAKAFYDAVLGALGMRCLMDFDGAAGYGRRFPEFWIQKPYDGQPAAAGNGVHICFFAADQEQVRAFHGKALELGGRDEGGPGYRKEYGDDYYAAFARDVDGNKIEAMVFPQKK